MAFTSSRNSGKLLRSLFTIAIVGGAFGSASIADAQTTATLNASKDNTIYESTTGNLSNGQGDYLFAGQTDDGDLRRALIRFDLSSIPANATITAATLTLTCSKVPPGVPAANTSLRRVSRDWGEGASNATAEEGAGATAQNGDATWLHAFFNTTSWSAVGGDFSSTVSATTSVGGTGSYSWSGSGVVADVQGWVANSATNFGWALIGNETAEQTARRFNSRHTASGPKLTVTYQLPGGGAPPQLLNISTRLRVETGDNALIGGFIVTGSQPKRVILRAIGPSLSNNGIAGALADPTLELVGGDGVSLALNDNWKDTQRAEIEATTIPPTADAESAIVRTLNPGNYTAVVRGKNNTTGVAVIEAYDLNQSADSRLANISTRGLVQTGTNVMIGGFIVGGEGNAKVIVRAIGPSLSQQGVANPLADPTLQLVDGNGAPLESNDNWRTDPDQAEIAAAGVAPQNDLESALLANIPPGNYTAVVAGKNSGTGIGLVEVYHLR